MQTKWFPGPGDRLSLMEVDEAGKTKKHLANISPGTLAPGGVCKLTDETRDDPATGRHVVVGEYGSIAAAFSACENYQFG